MRKENKSENAKDIFAEIFIDEKNLKENGIFYPIKLEYYKIKDEKDEYGVEVVKKEYTEKYTNIEKEEIIKITKEEELIENIIYKLKENLVTPFAIKDVFEENGFIEEN